jgi:uncharacterized protein YqhQ
MPNGCINVGGQAVIEGVMMRAPRSWAIAVRKPNSEIIVKSETLHVLSEKSRAFRLPMVRGVITLFSSLVLGIKALNFSANEAMEEEEKEEAGSEVLSTVAITLTMVFAFGLGIGLFVVLPHLISWLIGAYSPIKFAEESVVFHLIDGVVKMIIFIGYIWLIGLMPDIKRVFQYHGAEHMSIYAYENGDELTVENAKRYPTLHPRCGTSFLLFVLLLSFIVFALVFAFLPTFDDMNRILRGAIYIAIKIPLLLPIAGISYEILKLSAKKKDNPLVKLMIAPGMLMQKMTTGVPSDDQLEVALKALTETLAFEKKLDEDPTAEAAA